jgi:hypothetical protein
MDSDNLLVSLVIYFGPAIIFFVLAIWAVRSNGKKLTELIDVSRETHSSNAEVIRLLSEIKQSLQNGKR